MIFVLIVFLTIILTLMTGGTLHNLKHINIRHSWLPVVAVTIKLVTHTPLRYTLGISDNLAFYLYIISLVLIALFLLLNFRLRGFGLVAIGFICNALAIGFNGGYMPVKREYLDLIATAEDLEKINQGLPAFNYVLTGPDTKFYYLCDIFRMPDWVLVTRVFSIGDIILAVGGCIFAWHYLKSTQFHNHKITRYTLPR
ncbi:hypothetical protein P378_01845 [Desulforamulus profundi]|uniref:DUF5317 domain-containing protein n=1 Tax=Desulforamulus profundi TaxID=1383067 RepID=A0A2C6MIT7_9FIRM|nr:DUF5317 domain-containing protein [Desulforamulus profundi]PHJ39734.1 hypothetical protein P378_01845 [Desulforamulus profundi]